ncbi:MAG: hypothetical protein KGM42_16425 [Hyphomicrobiales bacterium]|nr:hypothetical protein [Hyphomicrobiales bacterium]
MVPENKTKRGATQREKFMEIAKSIGANEPEEAFNAKLRKVAAYKPSDQKHQRKTPGTKK